MISVTVTSVQNEDGLVTIGYTGSQSGPGNKVQFTAEGEMLSGPLDPSTEFGILAFFLRWWAGRDSRLADPSLVLNKTMTVDFFSAVPVQVA